MDPSSSAALLCAVQEIDKAVARINDAVCNLPEEAAGPLLVLPLYASLSPEMQLRVFRPAQAGVRRCIISTNVAETSVTVDGVVYVIDSGVVKQKSYNPATGMDALEVVPISRVQVCGRDNALCKACMRGVLVYMQCIHSLSHHITLCMTYNK